MKLGTKLFFVVLLVVFGLCGVIQADFYVNAAEGDDNNDGLTPETAFATIQKGVDMAQAGQSVLVYPGVYEEMVNFNGKAITVKSVAGAAVIENPVGNAVVFLNNEGPNSILSNFVIRNSFIAAFISGCSPTLTNLTVVGNDYGVEAYADAEPNVSSCIFWDNYYRDFFGCQPKYCQYNDGNGISENLISYWKFDEDSGIDANDSVGIYDGAVYGATWANGQIGGALDFNGIDDSVKLPNNDPVWLPTENFALSLWVYLHTDDITNELFFNGNVGYSGTSSNRCGWSVSKYPDSKVKFYVVIDDNLYQLASDTTLQSLTWYHIVAMRDGTSIKFYINGDEDGTLPCGAGSIDYEGFYSNDEVRIGALKGSTGEIIHETDGIIDDVQLYDEALSVEQIEDIYQSGLLGQELAMPTNLLFADYYNGDYHLLSERGRYWPEHDLWMLDDVTSLCIDIGDPNADPSGEPEPNGGRINAGAYGGTAYASLSNRQWMEGDIDQDGTVDMADFAKMAVNWLKEDN